MERIACSWCKAQNEEGTLNCVMCGAPLDATAKVTDSGWAEVPRLRDLAQFHFGQSVAQVDGEIVPVVEMALAGGDAVFFDHHTVLWKDSGLALEAQALGGGFKRMASGMPKYITWARGPGRIAFSRDAMGEIVVLPVHPGHEIDVRSHAFVVASHTLTYSFVSLPGISSSLHGAGKFMDRFVTAGDPGILVLHGYGNVFERTLAPGEVIHVEPGGFLYRDSSVGMEIEQQDVKTGSLRNGLYLVRFTGPGRVGVQSMYHHHTEE